MEKFSDGKGVTGAVASLIGGRSENQDSYALAESPLGTLVVVCDGMGGGPAGKTASSMATKAIVEYVSSATPDDKPESVLTAAASYANDSLLAAVEANPALRGMGTTCVSLLLCGNTGYVMHIGDSRCYQLRDGKTVFRTADHSYVGELVRRGTITEEEARVSGRSNVITRAVGTNLIVEPEVDRVEVKPGDRFALMTDGIWGARPEQQLVGMLAYDELPEKLVPLIARRIDSIGVSAGGHHDNLTLALVDIPAEKEPSPKPADADTDTVTANPNTVTAETKTVNDVFMEARENETPPVVRPLTMFQNPDSPDSGNVMQVVVAPPRKNTLLYILGAALLLSLGLNIWLLCSVGGTASEPSQPADDDPWTWEHPTPKPDNSQNSHSSQSSHSSHNSQNSQNSHNSHNSQNSHLSSPQTDSELDGVIETLRKVKDYKPDLKGKKGKDSKKTVERQREAMVRDALSRLGKAAGPVASTDAGKAQRMKAVADRMNKEINTMIRVDAKWLHSRDDANKAIDRTIAELEALK